MKANNTTRSKVFLLVSTAMILAVISCSPFIPGIPFQQDASEPSQQVEDDPAGDQQLEVLERDEEAPSTYIVTEEDANLIDLYNQVSSFGR